MWLDGGPQGNSVFTQKSVESLNGKYLTADSTEKMVSEVRQFAEPPPFNPNSVKIELVKMGLVRKQESREGKICMDSLGRSKTIYVCTICGSTLSREPPTECSICKTILVMPTDLYNHTIS